MRKAPERLQRRTLGVAHEVGNGKNAEQKYQAPLQGMFVPPDQDDDSEENTNSLYNTLINIKDWGIKKGTSGKRKLNSYLKTWSGQGDIGTLAAIMDMDVEELRYHLEDFGSTDELPGHQEKYESLTNEYGRDMVLTGLVPSQLITDLPDGSEQEVILEIFHRFHNYPFTYSGEAKMGEQGFLSKKGDCSTLLYMFVLAIQAAGIPITLEDCYGRRDGTMMVPGRPIHGRQEQRNIDGIDFWCFSNHYWFEYKGLHLDVLFMCDYDPGPSWSVASKVHQGISYRVFQNNCVFIETSHCLNLPGFNPGEMEPHSVGKGFASEAEAINFINLNS